ncbi:hypothetical protein CBR_g39394 [Chara braunii]|uniref:SMP-30/Gluconolactonase/LRE-like region domain-containing protein n=1 Tax=Chara braunii TaxID=69332 RepID=A0A388LRN9_CHABU|nr:hypothetical protein CBR_g39394 [Chara braunii]|eukprot:GBG84931.1 hypothetical protein CBR_g39394 [Chara braunii]
MGSPSSCSDADGLMRVEGYVDWLRGSGYTSGGGREEGSGGFAVFDGRDWAEVPVSTRLGVSCLFGQRSWRLLLALVMVALCCRVEERLCGGSGAGFITVAEGRPLETLSNSDVKLSKKRFLQTAIAPASSSAVSPSPCVTILNSSVIAGCTILVVHPGSSALRRKAPKGAECQSSIRNIVIQSDLSALFYIASENCEADFEGVSQESIMRVSFGSSMGSLSPPSSRPEDVQVSVLSYLWDIFNLSGPPPSFAPIGSAKPMVNVVTAALSADKRHLVVGAYPPTATETSWIVSLDGQTGVRSSIPINAAKVYGLAFNPNHTEMYIADKQEPPRLLVAQVDGFAPLPPYLNASSFVTLNSVNITSPLFGPYSLSGDGSCLYFLDDSVEGVWALDTASRKLMALLGKDGPIRLEFSFFESLGEIVVTSDGRQVFFTDFMGKLHRITLDTACGTPLSYEVVARKVDHELWGLAISPDDKYLYVGVGPDGAILQLALGQLS